MQLISLLVLMSACYIASGKLKRNRYETTTSSEPNAPPKQYKLFEGDIRVSKSFNPKKRNAVADKALLWPGGIIPYTISGKFNATSRSLFRGAMKMIEDATSVNGQKCIEFIPRTDEKNYANLEMYRDCWSDIGRLGSGPQTVSLGRQCYSSGTVVHELLHTLGFFHEQSRADRDQYVKIHTDNIMGGFEENFEKYALGSQVDHLNHPYDYESIMHYQGNSFAKDMTKPTITPKIKLPRGMLLGQRTHLSSLDISMIQSLYSCRTKYIPSVPSGQCRDKINNCYLYGDYACKELPQWAADNCARTCNVCQIDCRDKRDDCPSYGKSACSGKYESWATKNCAKFCGLGDCESLITTTQAAPLCEDSINNCNEYASSICVEYKLWASARCQKYCGFCKSAPEVTTEKPCVDTMDCTSYSKSSCKLFKSFMGTKCAKYCSFCTDSNKKAESDQQIRTTKPPRTTRITKKTRRPSTTPTTTTTTTTTTSKPEIIINNLECRDKISDCADYGKDLCEGQYKPFMSARCPKFCGVCKSADDTTTTTQAAQVTQVDVDTCKDSLKDCAAYTKSACSYTSWAKTNCPKFCDICSSKVTKQKCEDKRTDCYDFGKSQCNSQMYKPWMKHNCASFCNFC